MDTIFIECFGELEDPHMGRTKKRQSLDMLSLSIGGILSAAETREEIEGFGEENKEWFSQFLRQPNGIPSHETLSRVYTHFAKQLCPVDQ